MLSTPQTILTDSPNFNTTLEDIYRISRSSPLMTQNEVRPTSSALVSGGGQDQSADPDVNMTLPSPLSGSMELSELINTEGASWFDEIAGIQYESPASSGISLFHPNVFPASANVFPQATSGTIVSPSASVVSCSSQARPDPSASFLGFPAIYHKLQNAGAPFWASVTLDIQNFLWAKMSQWFHGREPTKTLFMEIVGEAIQRQRYFTAVWQRVSVTLDVPRIANLNATRETMIHNALQIKELLHVIAVEMTTTPGDDKFSLALIVSFTATWIRYRSRCYQRAAFIVLPSTDHDSQVPGLLPPFEEFTTDFRLKLSNLLEDHSNGWGLLHEHPSISTSSLPNSESSTQLSGLGWFGNSTLRDCVQRALYDPAYQGWFGFIEDVRSSDGHRSWAPVHTASPRQVGQVLGWIEELLTFHVAQANKTRVPFIQYAKPPDHFTAHDSVIKKVNRHVDFLSYLSGVVGDVKQDDPCVRIVQGSGEQLQACLHGYEDFSSRPAHLPYKDSVAEYGRRHLRQ